MAHPEAAACIITSASMATAPVHMAEQTGQLHPQLPLVVLTQADALLQATFPAEALGQADDHSLGSLGSVSSNTTSPTPSSTPLPAFVCTADQSSLCLGTILSIDPSRCDPAFVPQVGGTGRFEQKLCINCRADGIACLVERVRILTPGQEAAFQARSARHSRSAFWTTSTAVSQRFRVFNDKARCTGPKVVVFESQPPEIVNGEALVLPAADEEGADGRLIVRLWNSYGTLTLKRSRKAFRRQPHYPTIAGPGTKRRATGALGRSHLDDRSSTGSHVHLAQYLHPPSSVALPLALGMHGMAAQGKAAHGATHGAAHGAEASPACTMTSCCTTSGVDVAEPEPLSAVLPSCSSSRKFSLWARSRRNRTASKFARSAPVVSRDPMGCMSDTCSRPYV